MVVIVVVILLPFRAIHSFKEPEKVVGIVRGCQGGVYLHVAAVGNTIGVDGIGT